MISEAEYNAAIAGFKAGCSEVDVTFNRMRVGDEEQVQTLEEYAGDNAYVDEFTPLNDDEKLALLMALEVGNYDVFQQLPSRISKDDIAGWKNKAHASIDMWEDEIEQVLFPHISNKALFNMNETLWSDIMWAAYDDVPYNEFIAEYEADYGPINRVEEDDARLN